MISKAQIADRAYAEEIVISRPLGFHRQIIFFCCIVAIAFSLTLDLGERHGGGLYLRSTFTGIVAVGLMICVRRFYANVVDEMIAGPTYLIAHRGYFSVMIPLEQITTASFYFSRSYFFSSLGGFGWRSRFELRLSTKSRFGQTLAFIPVLGFRQSWPDTPLTRQLLRQA